METIAPRLRVPFGAVLKWNSLDFEMETLIKKSTFCSKTALEMEFSRFRDGNLNLAYSVPASKALEMEFSRFRDGNAVATRVVPLNSLAA